MICSVLPLGAFLSAEEASRMSRSLSFEVSPACQRLLQRVIEAGIGLFARHVPLENSKKSLHGSALRSRSLRSTPCRERFCEKRSVEANKTNGGKTRTCDSTCGPLLSEGLAILMLRQGCGEPLQTLNAGRLGVDLLPAWGGLFPVALTEHRSVPSIFLRGHGCVE